MLVMVDSRGVAPVSVVIAFRSLKLVHVLNDYRLSNGRRTVVWEELVYHLKL